MVKNKSLKKVSKKRMLKSKTKPLKKNISKIGKIKGLSLHFMPYSEIRELSISERIKKILNIILGNKILILQGKLRSEEEIRLIEDTMALVDHIQGFQGVELAVIESFNKEEAGFFFKMKQGMAKALVGDTSALTIIGPASIVKDIKRNPKKIEVMLNK